MRFLPVSENECERIAFILKLQPMFIVNSYALAVLFCFKGVTENADKMKLAVCRKTINKVLLDV